MTHLAEAQDILREAMTKRAIREGQAPKRPKKAPTVDWVSRRSTARVEADRLIAEGLTDARELRLRTGLGAGSVRDALMAAGAWVRVKKPRGRA